MSHHTNRRTFLDAPHSHTRAQRTASPPHSQSYRTFSPQQQLAAEILEACRSTFLTLAVIAVLLLALVGFLALVGGW